MDGTDWSFHVQKKVKSYEESAENMETEKQLRQNQVCLRWYGCTPLLLPPVPLERIHIACLHTSFWDFFVTKKQQHILSEVKGKENCPAYLGKKTPAISYGTAGGAIGRGTQQQQQQEQNVHASGARGSHIV